MNIKGRFVTLRAMRMEDQQLICDMFNDPYLENLVVGWAFPISIEQQIDWFQNHKNDKNSFRFIIETPEDGTVGIATLTDIDWKNRNANHGIKLANQSFRTKGIGTDAVMAIMRYAFEDLGLHRLNGAWFETNLASKGLYMKCGWKPEGIQRECIFKQGEWRDLTICGALVSDYYEAVERLNYWNS